MKKVEILCSKCGKREKPNNFCDECEGFGLIELNEMDSLVWEINHRIKEIGEEIGLIAPERSRDSVSESYKIHIINRMTSLTGELNGLNYILKLIEQ